MEGAPSGQGRHYLVLSRSWADLYDEVAGLFADWPDIRVVVDRRRDWMRVATRADRCRLLADQGRPLGARLVPDRFR